MSNGATTSTGKPLQRTASHPLEMPWIPRPTKGRCYFENITPNLTVEIMGCLGPYDLARLSLTCTRFYNILRTQEGPAILRRIRRNFAVPVPAPPPNWSEWDYFSFNFFAHRCQMCREHMTDTIPISLASEAIVCNVPNCGQSWWSYCTQDYLTGDAQMELELSQWLIPLEPGRHTFFPENFIVAGPNTYYAKTVHAAEYEYLQIPYEERMQRLGARVVMKEAIVQSCNEWLVWREVVLQTRTETFEFNQAFIRRNSGPVHHINAKDAFSSVVMARILDECMRNLERLTLPSLAKYLGIAHASIHEQWRKRTQGS